MLLLLPVVAIATSTAFACTTSYVHEWQDRSGSAPRAHFGKNFWKLWFRTLNVALSVLVRAFGFFVLLYILLLLPAALLRVGDQGFRLVGVICWLAAALFLSRYLLTVPILSYEGARPKPAIQLSLTLCRQHWRVAAQVTLVMLLVAVAPGVTFHGPTSLIMALIDPTSSRLDPWSDGLIALVGGVTQIAVGPVWTSLPALLYSGLKSLEAGGAPPPAPGPFRRP
jgi:hypothetical protein